MYNNSEYLSELTKRMSDCEDVSFEFSSCANAIFKLANMTLSECMKQIACTKDQVEIINLVNVGDFVFEIQDNGTIKKMKVVFSGSYDKPYCLATFGRDGCHQLFGFLYGFSWAKTFEDAQKVLERRMESEHEYKEPIHIL